MSPPSPGGCWVKYAHTHVFTGVCVIMAASREGWGGGIVREVGMDMCTLLCLKRMTNEDLLSRTGGSAECHVAAWTGGESVGEWTRVCVAEPLCCSPETTAALLVSRTPIRNKRF